MWRISRKLCRFLLMFLTGFTSFSVLLFPLSITFFVFVYGFWFCFMMLSWSTHLLMFLTLMSIIKGWLTYSGGTDWPGELCYNTSNYLTQVVNFPSQIPDCDSHNPALLDLFISSDASFCSTMAFLPFGNSDHVVVSVSIEFPSNPHWDALFHHIAYDYSHAD